MLYITLRQSFSATALLMVIFSMFPSFSNSFVIHFSSLPRTPVLLAASVVSNEGSTSNNTQTAAPSNEKQKTLNPKPTQKQDYDFPWTEKQVWALSDSLSRFTVQVPIKEERVDGVETTTLQKFTLWRTLSKEVVELSGYPLQFLVERQMELQNESDTESPTNAPKIIRTSRTILPYLDDYEFTTSGGLSGAVFGVQGVAEGTRIETAPLDDIRETIPKGFVRTECSVLYELGSPRNQEDVQSLGSRAGSLISSAKDAAQDYRPGEIVKVGPLDRELVQLGALTGVLLLGASAFETLSHHLTVNVFWV